MDFTFRRRSIIEEILYALAIITLLQYIRKIYNQISRPEQKKRFLIVVAGLFSIPSSLLVLRFLGIPLTLDMAETFSMNWLRTPVVGIMLLILSFLMCMIAWLAMLYAYISIVSFPVAVCNKVKSWFSFRKETEKDPAKAHGITCSVNMTIELPRKSFLDRILGVFGKRRAVSIPAAPAPIAGMYPYVKARKESFLKALLRRKNTPLPDGGICFVPGEEK